MPIGGRKPKPPGEAVNRNKPVFDWTEVEDTPYEDGPKLYGKRANGENWPDRVRDRWQVWRRMPHARLWTDADWEFILDTLEVYARFCETGEVKYATEMRSREKIIGTTIDSRRDLRIRYIEPQQRQAPLAAVVNADDFRNL